MSQLFPFVTLKSLNNGYTFYSKIKKILKQDYYKELIKINNYDINKIADYFNGINLKSKFFESLNWILYLNPVPNLNIYFLSAGENSSNKFSVIYGRESKNVPTEEVYGFTLMYIITLSKIGNGSINLKKINTSDKLISLKTISNDTFKTTIERFFNDLKLLDVPFLKEKLSKISMFSYKNNIIHYNVFKDFFIKIKLDGNKNIFINKEALNIHGRKIIITFTGLIINALKRELIK